MKSKGLKLEKWYSEGGEVFKDIGDYRYKIAEAEGDLQEAFEMAKKISRLPQLLGACFRIVESFEPYKDQLDSEEAEILAEAKNALKGLE